jgi:hypothetical protein
LKRSNSFSLSFSPIFSEGLIHKMSHRLGKIWIYKNSCFKYCVTWWKWITKCSTLGRGFLERRMSNKANNHFPSMKSHNIIYNYMHARTHAHTPIKHRENTHCSLKLHLCSVSSYYWRCFEESKSLPSPLGYSKLIVRSVKSSINWDSIKKVHSFPFQTT